MDNLVSNYQSMVNDWNNIKLNHLRYKINKYKRMDKTRLNYDELKRLIYSIVLINGNFQMPFVCNYIPNRNYHAYRARKVNDGSFLKWELNQYWEKPVEYSSDYERLTVPGQSPLYLSNNIITTLGEVRAKKDDVIILSKFNVKDDFTLTPLNFNNIYNWFINKCHDMKIDLSQHAKYIFKEYINFFKYLFTAKTNSDSDLVYKQSNAIIESLYYYPKSIGWIYPSIQKNSDLYTNYCIIAEKAHKKLNLSGSIAIKIKQSSNINVICVRPTNTTKWYYNKKLLNKEFPELF